MRSFYSELKTETSGEVRSVKLLILRAVLKPKSDRQLPHSPRDSSTSFYSATFVRRAAHWQQDCGPIELPGPKPPAPIRLSQRIAGGGVRDNANAGRHGQKVQPILPPEIGHGQQLSFSPKPVIGKSGDRAHVDAGAYHPAALADCLQSQWHKIADGRENDRDVELLRGRSSSDPPAQTAPRERAKSGRSVSGAGGRVDRPTLPDIFANLRNDTRAAAPNPAEAHASALSGESQGAPADQSCAKQRRASDSSLFASPSGSAKRASAIAAVAEIHRRSYIR